MERKTKIWGESVRASSDRNSGLLRKLGWEWKPSFAPPSHPQVGAGPLRRVKHQSVPLPLHIIILRLFSDVEAIKLQLPGQLLLPLKDHQGHLDCAGR